KTTLVVFFKGILVSKVTYTSTQICAFKGSTVEIRCSYTYPSTINGLVTKVKKRFWFTELGNGESVDLTTISEYTQRVQYHSENNDCTLRISDLRERDSAEYKFRFITNHSTGKYTGSPGVTLSVTAILTLHVRCKTLSPSAEIVEGSSVTLTCSRDANPAAKYTYWYKEKPVFKYLSEGPQLIFSSIRSSDSGQYYCRKSNLIFDGPKLPSVSVSPSAEIVEGSSVNLTCSSDANPAANYTWYKENEDSPKASGQIFTITDFRAEHSGNYYCEAQNRRGRQNSTLHLTVVAGKFLHSATTVNLSSVNSCWNNQCCSPGCPIPLCLPVDQVSSSVSLNHCLLKL
uniref:B-cell receptor CD22 n=1 Tax=Sander lucioperca TaxID=283035 RepID=A0A8C9XEW5_SANLU